MTVTTRAATYRGEDTGSCPHQKASVHAPRVLEDAGGANEYARTNNGADDYGDAIEQRHLRLEFDLVVPFVGGGNRVVRPLLAIFDAP